MSAAIRAAIYQEAAMFSAAADHANRRPQFIAREVRGMCVGAGAFVVVDTFDGSECGMTLWRDEAEKTARRLNARTHGDAR